MDRDALISKLMAAERNLTRLGCIVFLDAIDACGLEIVPKRSGRVTVGGKTPPPSFSHGRTVVAERPKHAVVVSQPTPKSEPNLEPSTVHRR